MTAADQALGEETATKIAGHFPDVPKLLAVRRVLEEQITNLGAPHLMPRGNDETPAGRATRDARVALSNAHLALEQAIGAYIEAARGENPGVRSTP